MARTRYRKRSSRRFGRSRRRRSVFKRKTFRRRYYKRRFRRRRSNMRRRLRSRRGVSFSIGKHGKFGKFLTIRSTYRARSIKELLGDSSQTNDSAYYKTENPLTILQCPFIPSTTEIPDIYPTSGHNGLFFVFSLDTYIRAIVSSWAAYRFAYAVGTTELGNRSYGIKGKMHPDELAYRKHILDYARNNLYKISIRFVRRVGRTTDNVSFVPGYDIPAPQLKGTATTSAWTGTVSSDPLNVAAPLRLQWNSIGDFVYPGSNAIPWYSQSIDYLTSPFLFHKAIRNGFSGKDSDPISGNSDAAVAARICRLLAEMRSGHGEWKKNSGSSTLKFSLRKSKKAGDFIIFDPVGSAGFNTEVKCPASYSVNKDVSNSLVGTNSVENNMAPRYESRVYTGEYVDSGNIVTIPCNNGPRGSIIVWCPHNLDSLNSCYDIEVSGHYLFTGKGKSALDLPLDRESMEM